jgi:hypothetical protein
MGGVAEAEEKDVSKAMNKAILQWYLRTILAKPFLRAVDWTKEERAQFDLFARSSCGIKLFEFLRQTVASTTFNAVYQEKVSANQYARGMQDILGLLHRLRAFPPEVESEFDLDEVEPLPSQRDAFDGRRFGFGGNSAIR